MGQYFTIQFNENGVWREGRGRRMHDRETAVQSYVGTVSKFKGEVHESDIRLVRVTHLIDVIDPYDEFKPYIPVIEE